MLWPTYMTGDDTGLVATDFMNFVQRETLNYIGRGLESYARFLAEKFLSTYSQAEGVQIETVEIPCAGIPGSAAFAPSGPGRASAKLELQRNGVEFRTVEALSGRWPS